MRLHLALEILTDIDNIATAPWELLHDPSICQPLAVHGDSSMRYLLPPTPMPDLLLHCLLHTAAQTPPPVLPVHPTARSQQRGIIVGFIVERIKDERHLEAAE